MYVVSRKLGEWIPHCDKTPVGCGILAFATFLFAMNFYRLRTIRTLMTLAIHRGDFKLQIVSYYDAPETPRRAPIFPKIPFGCRHSHKSCFG